MERTCAHAQKFAAELGDAGFEMLNGVVINRCWFRSARRKEERSDSACLRQWKLLVRGHRVAGENPNGDQRFIVGYEPDAEIR